MEGADNGTRITKIQPQKSGSIQSANETLRNSHVESKPKTILSNDMTNNDKLMWFAAFKSCLEKNELAPNDLEGYRMRIRLLFDCISPNLTDMLSESCNVEGTLTGDQGL